VSSHAPLPIAIVLSNATQANAMSRIGEDSILARTQRGLGRMEQIRFAVLEVNGKISVIPQEQLHE